MFFKCYTVTFIAKDLFRFPDGEEESGAIADECDTQEEEFESEEMWRKQRHEREMFLKKMVH